MPREERDRIERFDELHGFLHQSVISTKDMARVETLRTHQDRKVAAHAALMLSINSLDRDPARKLEPRAASPNQRLAAVEALARAGVPVGVMVAPIFVEWLEQNVPEKKDKIPSRIRVLRGCRLNDPRFGHRMTGEGILCGRIAGQVRSASFRFSCPGRGRFSLGAGRR